MSLIDALVIELSLLLVVDALLVTSPDVTSTEVGNNPHDCAYREESVMESRKDRHKDQKTDSGN